MAAVSPLTVSASVSSTTAGPILDGRRNNTLYRLARSLKVKGIEPPAIELSLRSVNHAQCHPPLDEREIQQIVEQATTQANSPDFTNRHRGNLRPPQHHQCHHRH